MLELRTLGTLDLRERDGPTQRSLLAQPKRTALLIYLALAHPRGLHQRDTLIAMFWPEKDTEHARQALRQALRFLRASLGDAIESRGDGEVGVAADRLWCDAVELDRWLEQGRAEEAVALYGGDLLPGFHVGDAPEFERWLARERERLRSRAAEAAWRVADACESEGDTGRAVDWARRAASLSPADEMVTRRLMALLEGAGDRAAAVLAYEAFARRLGEEYELEPSDETRSLVEAIRNRRGPGGTASRRRPEPASPETITTLASGSSAEWLAEGAARTRVGGRRRRTILTAVLAGLALVGYIAAFRGKKHTLPGDPEVVVVLPFRIGSADSSLSHLRDGMVELLALKLTGEGGPRAVTPSTMFAAGPPLPEWSAADLPPSAVSRLAGRLGAGRVIEGAVVGDRQQLTLTASLHVPANASTGVRATATGPYDSLTLLVDRLVAHLLTGGTGPDREMASMTTLPVLLAYLEGRAAFRRARWGDAVKQFDRALSLDSTFAPAAVGLHSASLWLDRSHVTRAARLAWQFRDRLAPRERMLLAAELGPDFPRYYTQAEQLLAWKQVIATDAHLAHAWHRLGDLFYHHGNRLGLEAPLAEARAAFERALALDSVGGSEARSHLIDIAAMTGDSAALRPLIRAVLAADSGQDNVRGYAWLTAFTERDSSGLDLLRRGFERMPPGQLWKIWTLTQVVGYDVEDAVRAQEALAASARSSLERSGALTAAYYLELNRGRPLAAQNAAAGIHLDWYSLDRLAVQVLSSLYGDGDAAAGSRAARTLATWADAPLEHRPEDRHEQLMLICVVQQWRVARGEFGSAPSAIARLRVSDSLAPTWLAAQSPVCAALLEAWLAAAAHAPDAGRRLELVDSMARTGTADHWSFNSDRLIARLWEARGEWARALAAIRRRNPDRVQYLAADLREEGRLASLTGDTAGAILAYRHYLALRFDPEPVLRTEVDRVRAELARLAESSKPRQ